MCKLILWNIFYYSHIVTCNVQYILINYFYIRSLWEPTHAKINSPPNSTQRRFPSFLLLYISFFSYVFPFHFLPSPLHPTGFSFCFFPGTCHSFLVVFEQQQYIHSDALYKAGEQYIALPNLIQRVTR